MDFENNLSLGRGIYTAPDIAQILRLPYYKINRWINEYWDGRLGKEFNEQYSWTIDITRAISFHTLVEFYIFYMLSKSGVKTKKILEAHSILVHENATPFPFAISEILENLTTDGKNIFFKAKLEHHYHTLDKTKQFNFDFIKAFFKKLDFDKDSLASRLWPLGKDKSIVCDPRQQFGQPVIYGTNIYPETLANMYQAGDSIKLISHLYSLEDNQVKNAIEYCKKVA